MRKLKLDGQAIEGAIRAMPALERVKVAVVGNQYRRQDHLVVAEAGAMQRCLQAIVDKKNEMPSPSARAAEMRRPVDAAAFRHVSTLEHDVKVEETASQSPSTSEEWPAQRYSNCYERFQTPEPYGWYP